MMYFVTDCDNTLVHYDRSVFRSNDELQQMVDLPASSGSGKVAFISKKTVETLDELHASGVCIICATGMRNTTMMQRQPYMPGISYWIVENGGRVYEKDSDGKMVEIEEWRRQLQQDEQACDSLRAFATQLRAEGYSVDDKAYETMIRIKGEDVAEVISRIPPELQHTFNLGYLDIQLRGCGKRPASEWLISRLHQQRAEPDEVTNPSVTGVSQDGDVTSSSRKLVPEYLFMGDDTNDIDIASSATIAGIVRPPSGSMHEWLLSQANTDAYDKLQSSQVDDARTSGNMGQKSTVIAVNSERNLFTSKQISYRATEDLLNYFKATRKLGGNSRL
jgi:hydroxymethylpyrimidine pyrophosphatase-like HAD family hydrolase